MMEHDVRIAARPDGPVETDAVIKVLTLAFSTDAAVRYMFPKAETYLAAFPRLAAAMGGSWQQSLRRPPAIRSWSQRPAHMTSPMRSWAGERRPLRLLRWSPCRVSNGAQRRLMAF